MRNYGRKNARVDYYTVASHSLADGSLVLGAQYSTLEAAQSAYIAACSDCAGLKVTLGVKHPYSWLGLVTEYTSNICTECLMPRPFDERVAAGMKCVRCAY